MFWLSFRSAGLFLMLTLWMLPAWAQYACSFFNQPLDPVSSKNVSQELNLRAHFAELDTDRYQLSGSVQGSFSDYQFETSRLFYNVSDQTLSMPDPGMIQKGTDYIDFESSNADILNNSLNLRKVRYIRLTDDPTAKQYQARSERLDINNEQMELRDVQISACIADDPSVYFKAKRAVAGKERFKLYHTTLFFGPVGVFYWPYLSLPAQSGRASGFLFPYLDASSHQGVQFSLPYYWNISPAYDLLLTPRMTSKDGSFVSASARYLTHERSSGQIAYEASLTDRQKERLLNWQHQADWGQWHLDVDWYWPSKNLSSEQLTSVSGPVLQSSFRLAGTTKNSWLGIESARHHELSDWDFSSGIDRDEIKGAVHHSQNGMLASMEYGYRSQVKRDQQERPYLEQLKVYPSLSYFRPWSNGGIKAKLGNMVLWQEQGDRDVQGDEKRSAQTIASLGYRTDSVDIFNHSGLKAGIRLDWTEKKDEAADLSFYEEGPLWISEDFFKDIYRRTDTYQVHDFQRLSLDAKWQNFSASKGFFSISEIWLMHSQVLANSDENEHSTLTHDLSLMRLRNSGDYRWNLSALYDHDESFLYQANMRFGLHRQGWSVGYNYLKDQWNDWVLGWTGNPTEANQLSFSYSHDQDEDKVRAASFSYEHQSCCFSSELNYSFSRDQQQKPKHQIQLNLNFL